MAKLLSHYFLLFSKMCLVGIVVALFFFQTLKVFESPSFGAWGIFHYYLGAKYLKELGYFNLYSCATQINIKAWQETRTVRNLLTYRLVPIKDLPKCPINSFTNSRWNEFANDTAFITSHASTDYWSHVITDKGFNPPPFWAALSGIIANTFPLNNNLTYIILFNLDLLFIITAAILVWYSLGRTAAFITLLLSLLYFGTFGTLFNNFIQYAWYPLIASSVIFWQKKKAFLSGITLGFAAGMQAFPAIFAIPVGVLALQSIIRRKKEKARLSFLFILSFVATILFCFLFGSLYAGKIQIWQEWYSKINIHKNYLNGEIFNIGLSNLIGTFASSDHASSGSYIDDYSHSIARSLAFNQNVNLWYLIVFLGLSLILFLLWRSKQNNPMVFGYFLLYLLLSLSPYYYLILALLPFMFWESKFVIRRFVIYGTFFLFLLNLILFWNRDYVSFIYNLHLISEISIFLFLAIILILLFFEKPNRYP